MQQAVSRSVPCLGGLAVRWALFGFVVAVLWEWAGPALLVHVAVWIGALIAGMALGLRELERGED